MGCGSSHKAAKDAEKRDDVETERPLATLDELKKVASDSFDKHHEDSEAIIENVGKDVIPDDQDQDEDIILTARNENESPQQSPPPKKSPEQKVVEKQPEPTQIATQKSISGPKQPPPVKISQESAVVSLPPIQAPKVTLQPEAMIDFDFDILPERDPFPSKQQSYMPKKSPMKEFEAPKEMDQKEIIDELLADLEEDFNFG